MLSEVLKDACHSHLISTPTNAHNKIFTLKHLKSLQHFSILRSFSGSNTVPC